MIFSYPNDSVPAAVYTGAGPGGVGEERCGRSRGGREGGDDSQERGAHHKGFCAAQVEACRTGQYKVSTV